MNRCNTVNLESQNLDRDFLLKAGHSFTFLFLVAILFSSISNLKGAESRVEDIQFTADCDKSIQRYVILFPKDFDATKPCDLLIALHGHGSDRWQFVRDKDGEFKACRDAASERKMLYVSPDYRAKTSWMGPKAEQDMLQIISDLKKRFSIERTFICGGSMGGTSALTFTALHPDLISGVVAMNGTANLIEFPNFEDAISKSFGGKKSKISNEYKIRSAEYWPEKLTMPIAFTTGAEDKIVPPDSVMRLHKILQRLDRPTLLTHQEKGGHSTTYDDATTSFKFVFEKAAPFQVSK